MEGARVKRRLDMVYLKVSRLTQPMVSLLFGKAAMNHLIMRPSKEDLTVAIVRHSERPSFESIPMEKWGNVTITERGVEAAKDFGRAAAIDAGINNLRVYHWGQRRCADTADALAAGSKEAGCSIRERNALQLLSPIADESAYQAALKLGGWERLLNDWQSTEEGHVAMVPMKKYASEVFRTLLGDEINRFGEVSIIVAHDLQIFPLASSVFGGPVTKVGYLDGLVLSKTAEGEILVGFGDSARRAQPSDLLLPKT